MTAWNDLGERSPGNDVSLHRADPPGRVLKRVLSVADTTDTSYALVSVHDAEVLMLGRVLECDPCWLLIGEND